MQKLTFSIALAFFACVVNAQSTDDVAKLLDKKKFQQAKEGIDKLTADPNSKDAYAWLLKAQVYNAISTDDALKATVPDACEIAFESYKKATDINPNETHVALDINQSGYRAYDCVGNKAALAFQNSKYPEALDAYKKLLSYGAYLNSKNLTNKGYPPKFDTAVIFYVGYIAMKLDKEDDALTYFSKMANAKIAKEPDYIIPYQFLAYTYKEKKDEENFKKYLNLGRQAYPTSPYFPALKIDWARDNNNYPELFAGYDELIPLQPDSMKHYLIYANDIFEYAFVKNPDKRPDNFPALASKMDSLLKITLAHGYDSLNSLMILTGLYYNQGLDYAGAADKLKTSTKPEDVKKRKDLTTSAVTYYDKAIPYAEQTVKLMETMPQSAMKSSEKQRLKNLYGWLGDMYRVKGDKVKADAYDKKWDAVNLK